MDTDASPSTALADAVEIAGSQSAMAKICGVGQPAVSKWLRKAKPLPAEHVRAVEAATGVPSHALRPDLFSPSEVPAERTVGTGAPIVSCDRGAGMQRNARA